MILEKDIENINKTEIDEIRKKLSGKGIRLDKHQKYIFTIDRFEVFFRLYIDKDIQVFIRTNTLNCKESVNYEFFNFNTAQVTNIDEYRENVKLFYENIIKEVLNTTYCPESHTEMIPTNRTQEELDNGWYLIYEKRLLKILDYNNMKEFKEWIEKVTDEKYILEQKTI